MYCYKKKKMIDKGKVVLYIYKYKGRRSSLPRRAMVEHIRCRGELHALHGKSEFFMKGMM